MRMVTTCSWVAGLLFAIPAIAEPEVPGPTKDSIAQQTDARAHASEVQLVRATFSTRIEDREPTDPIEQLTTAYDHVFFFTEVVGMQGLEIVHRWEHDGELVAEIPLSIQGPRWRVFSSKELPAEATGTWAVTVVGRDGQVLAHRTLEYISAEPAAADVEKVADDLEP